jgi:hypothetical protein
MDNDKIDSNLTANQAECTSRCESGCCGNKTGISKRMKIIICLVVAIAAAAVLAQGIMQKADSNSDLEQNSTNLSLWGEPLASLDSLNKVASNTDTAFLYLPVAGLGPNENVKNEIESAAGKAQSQGTSVAFFMLDDGSEDYRLLTSQVPAPLVLVLVNGANLSLVPANISEVKGMSFVSGNISEENLLYALVAASRASIRCCPLPSTESPSAKCC